MPDEFYKMSQNFDILPLLVSELCKKVWKSYGVCPPVVGTRLRAWLVEYNSWIINVVVTEHDRCQINTRFFVLITYFMELEVL